MLTSSSPLLFLSSFDILYKVLTENNNRARPVDPVLATRYIKGSLSYGSGEMRRIQRVAAEAGIAVVLGFSENEGDSLYISQCVIDAGGKVVMKRRKLKPTHMERTVFGDAGGSSLNNVVEVEGVGRVGALSCWEHMQPLLKYHTMSLREQIHVAAWPPIHPAGERGEVLFSMTAEGMSLTPVSPILYSYYNGDQSKEENERLTQE
jgi:nitrilase